MKTGTSKPVVLVTGGAGGIGAALAQRYAADGAAAVLLDYNPDALQEAADRLAAEGVTAGTIHCDVTDAASIDKAIERVRSEYGRLDVLVHSAGLTHVSPCVETELSVYRRVMEVNFFGTVALTKAVLPMLIESAGRIVVLSSIAGFAPLLARTGYCASKHALHGFFDTLRGELVDAGVSVTLACPSFVETGFAKAGLAGNGSILPFDRSTTGKPLTTAEVAEAIHRAATKRKHLIVLSRTGKASYWVSRLLPALYERMMISRFRVEMERGADAK